MNISLTLHVQFSKVRFAPVGLLVILNYFFPGSSLIDAAFSNDFKNNMIFAFPREFGVISILLIFLN